MTTMHPAPTDAVPTPRLEWGTGLVALTFQWDDDAPVVCAAIRLADRAFPIHRIPFVEVLTADAGHRPASGRLAHTELGL
ncbi:hypothetical protein, partial [Streptomyces scabiei]|uniref:hypothetical protein n=1 Tax=Streptomyces scabiei TaxID=1930 RepID=UPI0038F7483D